MMMATPDLFLFAIAFVVSAICLNNWFMHNDYIALGYLVPLGYCVVISLLGIVGNVDNAGRVIMYGGGLIIFMICVVVWRIVFLIRQKRRNNV